ncbi:MAG: translocation/assembly module TamB domain-containing protein [Gammaproteobacteria bacterium]
MVRIIRWIAWSFATLLGLVLLLLIFVNTSAALRLIESQVARLTAGEVRISGLDGRLPDEFRADRIELYDSEGLWLAIEEFRFDWDPGRLLLGTVRAERLEARHIFFNRLPQTTPSPSEEESEFSLPVRIVLDSLRVDRLDLAEPVAGTAAALSIEGNAALETLTRGEVDLSVGEIDGEGRYVLRGLIDYSGVNADLSAQEASGGLLGTLAGLPPDISALNLHAAATGPLSKLQTTVALDAGPVNADIHGTLDLNGQAGDLSITAKTPRLALRPDLFWQSVALDGRVSGPFGRPTAKASLQITGLGALDTRVANLHATIDGDAGNLNFSAALEGIEIPGPRPALLRTAPLRLEGNVRLDQKDRPLTFAIHHPLVSAEGSATTAEKPGGRLNLKLPDLTPIASLAGLDLRGSSELSLGASTEGQGYRLDLSGKLAVTGGKAPIPGLVGDRAKFDLALTGLNEEITLTRLYFRGRTLDFSAEGKLRDKAPDLNFNLALSDLEVLAPRFSGHLSTAGKVQGLLDDLAVNADLQGEFSTERWPPGPIQASIQLRGLPEMPSGTVTAHGVLDRAPLELALKVHSTRNRVLHLAIDRADWKSAHAEGTLQFPKKAGLPIGKFDLRMESLADLAPLLGQNLSGSVALELETSGQNAHLRFFARDTEISDTASIKQAALNLDVSNPLTHPIVDGRLNLDGIRAGTTSGSLRLEASGPDHALALRLSSALKNLADSDASVQSAAMIDVPAGRVTFSSLEATWKEQLFKLLAPARIDYQDGLTIERLRLALGKQGKLDVSGRVMPNLSLEVSLREVPADLAKLFAPGLDLDGVLQANAHLHGPLEHPAGSITLSAKGIRLRSGSGRAMPPADLGASAELDGDRARIDARLNAGSSTLNLSGNAAFDPSGPLDLSARGSLDLALLEPVLAAQGRRARGRITLDARTAGSRAAPIVRGTVELSGGELLDYVQGAHIGEMTALLRADGDTLYLDRFDARAGPGTIHAQGNIGIAAEGVPVDLRLSARNAQPLSSDRITVDLNADLTLKGQAVKQMLAAGRIHINRAEIMIPERTPASIAVLEIRKPGEQTPPPSKQGPAIGLDLEIDAPNAIFVRGRGVDAELAGKIRIRGTTARIKPLGDFEMRRGQFSLAGQTLTFSKGEVGFHGGSLSDPSLLFIAKTFGGGVTAILTVEGTANKPKIQLSSDPSMPQDEVLAQLLFGRGTANLSPLEWVQIASAVSSLTGVTSGGNPLETVRKGLGLDRLSFGSDTSGSPTLEAGRYVAPGIYVGTKQGVSGTGTQATVQIDVTKGLKVQSSIGTGAPSGSSGSNTGTSSVGVIYELEY